MQPRPKTEVATYLQKKEHEALFSPWVRFESSHLSKGQNKKNNQARKVEINNPASSYLFLPARQTNKQRGNNPLGGGNKGLTSCGSLCLHSFTHSDRGLSLCGAEALQWRMTWLLCVLMKRTSPPSAPFDVVFARRNLSSQTRKHKTFRFFHLWTGSC